MSDDFASRWSRRKAAVAAQEAAESAAEAEQTREAEAAEKTDEELLEELGLPDPDTLAPGDDVTAFLKEAVPERLRRRALRRLWRLNPTLANVDGLVDYGGDFTDAATVPDTIATAYQIGRGIFAKLAEEEPKPAETAEPASQTEADPGEDPPTIEQAAPAAPEPVEDATAEAEPAPPPSRMTFRFEN
ncbi:DUF3306 domain-containing protein [Pontivivens ytuae]|uniref:DUF3306 domain-containing protein n=1 Tax=Pontivivens ytuae TaxID=2789856 RepID=A0A7S9LQN3_9RHOB|nr:DUF3306 domain-containing protein [Pontivivens ytuae]QPH53200.1 DUF3306 domain-containing protein [Pontivivens ytuae]